MRSARRSTWAALTVQAPSASAGESRSCVQAMEQTSGRLSQKELPGLKSVARATAAPASRRLLAGGMGRPRKSALAGRRTDTTSEAAWIVESVDVFLERGAFTADQARRYLVACSDAGLGVRLHGDQFTESGAVPLAVELGARSVDHLEATGAEGIRTLADSEVVGVLLPASALVLGRPMPPARALVDAGAAVALATDFNPGSAFCESLPLVCSLACTQLGLSPAEALGACTVNAAHVLRRADRIGRLAPGYRADVVLLDAPDWRYLAYHVGGPVVKTVLREGRRLG